MSVQTGYRHLLRVCKSAFKGDSAALNVAVQEIKTQVYSKADIKDPDQLRKIVLRWPAAAFTPTILRTQRHCKRNFTKRGSFFHTTLSKAP